MSVLTTTPLKSAPSGATGVTVTPGALPTWGAWVEILSATAAPSAVAGAMFTGGTYSDVDYELDLGVGAVGAEASVGTLRLHFRNSANAGQVGYLLPVPLGGIGSGVRVAVRARARLASGPTTVALLYYETLSSDQVTTSNQVLTSAPAGALSPLLTPSATPWANSAWVELIASSATGVGLLGLVHGSSIGSEAGVEYDLGVGASGAETVLTTLRDARAEGITGYTWLPGLTPVAAGTRVSVRLRKAGTDTATQRVALLYYTNTSGAPAAVTGTGAVTIGAPTLAGSGTVAPPAITGTGSVTFGVPALAGEGALVVPVAVTQLLAEVFQIVPHSPLAATQVAAELLLALAPQPDQARVTQLCCEVIVVPRVTVCRTDFPIDPMIDAVSCPVSFPTTAIWT